MLDGALLGYRAGNLVIALEGETGLGSIADDWKQHGYMIVATTREDALKTWHTVKATGNPHWDQAATSVHPSEIDDGLNERV